MAARAISRQALSPPSHSFPMLSPFFTLAPPDSNQPALQPINAFHALAPRPPTGGFFCPLGMGPRRRAVLRKSSFFRHGPSRDANMAPRARKHIQNALQRTSAPCFDKTCAKKRMGLVARYNAISGEMATKTAPRASSAHSSPLAFLTAEATTCQMQLRLWPIVKSLPHNGHGRPSTSSSPITSSRAASM